MKKYLLLATALAFANVTASENPFEVNSNIDIIDKDENSLLGELQKIAKKQEAAEEKREIKTAKEKVNKKVDVVAPKSKDLKVEAPAKKKVEAVKVKTVEIKKAEVKKAEIKEVKPKAVKPEAVKVKKEVVKKETVKEVKKAEVKKVDTKKVDVKKEKASKVKKDQARIEQERIKLEASKKVANKIIFSLSSPFNISGQEVNINTSIGIALYPEHGKDADSLITLADNAMYKSKDQGTGHFNF